MDTLTISGGKKLQGEIHIEGSKNAVLPILAATVLNSSTNIIKNCPRIKDVEIVLSILQRIGCKVSFEGNMVVVDSSGINSTVIPEEFASEMRSSIVFMGPMLAKYKKVTISYPGGYAITMNRWCMPHSESVKACRRQ